MAYLAIRGSGSVNGVSRLHGQVSRQLFAPLFPHWPVDAVPIGYVTNGVHHPTWDSAAADDLWTKACGKDRWLGITEKSEQQGIRHVSDEILWQLRTTSTECLVDYARDRLARHYVAAGASTETIEQAKHLFDPKILTLGFARRFATYKRPNLLLHDPERLLRLLSNPQRPVQLMIAGKAHPADLAGQALIQKWIQFIRRPEVRAHAVFLSDYDMQLTERLVQGVDVWLNTPRRPWEACGTSGMKVLVNGGLNLSELDGWWAEAYASDLGWGLRQLPIDCLTETGLKSLSCYLPVHVVRKKKSEIYSCVGGLRLFRLLKKRLAPADKVMAFIHRGNDEEIKSGSIRPPNPSSAFGGHISKTTGRSPLPGTKPRNRL